ERIVEAVPAVLEEDVAAHLACKRCARLLHLRLDKAVPGLPHQGRAAHFGDPVEQLLACFHVGDDGGAGLFLENWTGKDHQPLVQSPAAARAPIPWISCPKTERPFSSSLNPL